MAKRLPKRDARGRFVSGGRSSRKRSRPRSRKKARRNLPPRGPDGKFQSRGRRSVARRSSRSPARRNPPGFDPGAMLGRVGNAALAATAITVGKAGSRSLPRLARLPEAGPVGVAIRVSTGVLLGFAADAAGFEDLGLALMVGGMQGGVEDLAVGYNVPWIGPALARPAGMIAPAPGNGEGTTARYRTAASVGGGTTARYLPRSGAGGGAGMVRGVRGMQPHHY